MIAPVRIAGLKFDRFFPTQPERSLRFQAHAHMGIRDPVKLWPQIVGLADMGHIAPLGHAKLCIVRRQDIECTTRSAVDLAGFR